MIRNTTVPFFFKGSVSKIITFLDTLKFMPFFSKKIFNKIVVYRIYNWYIYIYIYLYLVYKIYLKQKKYILSEPCFSKDKMRIYPKTIPKFKLPNQGLFHFPYLSPSQLHSVFLSFFLFLSSNTAYHRLCSSWHWSLTCTTLITNCQNLSPMLLPLFAASIVRDEACSSTEPETFWCDFWWFDHWVTLIPLLINSLQAHVHLVLRSTIESYRSSASFTVQSNL